MSTLRRVFAFLVAVTVLGAVQEARAQTTLPTTTTIALAATPVVHSLPRTGFRLNTQINYADCVGGDVLNFSVVLTNRLSYILQAWAGSGCDNIANRTTTGATLCWKLFDALPSGSSPNSPTVSIAVADLVAGQTLYGAQTSTTTSDGSSGSSGTSGVDAGVTAGTGGTGGTTTTTTTPTNTLPTGTLVQGTGPQACIDNSGIPVVTPVTVYFMLVDTTGNIQGNFVTWPGTYKLLAPNPPDNVSAAVGDTLLPVQFSYIDNQSTDMTINGYQIFCDPPPGGGAADAGVTPVPTDAGVVTPDCSNDSQLVAGEIAASKFQCGSASVSATSANATGLVNGVSYHVGVAATDTYENIGKVSTLSCEVPQPVDGFFKEYRAAGGKGGGGFCSFSMKREPLPWLALLGLASCLALRRRRAA
jgi:hypothetical protein